MDVWHYSVMTSLVSVAFLLYEMILYIKSKNVFVYFHVGTFCLNVLYTPKQHLSSSARSDLTQGSQPFDVITFTVKDTGEEAERFLSLRIPDLENTGFGYSIKFKFQINNTLSLPVCSINIFSFLTDAYFSRKHSISIFPF